MLQFPRCYLSLFQVHTCTIKLLEIETALRCVSVCFFFLLFVKTCFKCCLVLPNDYSPRPSSPERSCGWRGGGGGEEGEVATTSLEFEYLHGKSRWEMLIGGYDINNDVITLGALLMFVYIFLLFLLFAGWGKSDSSVDGEPQGSWRWNSNSRDVMASSPWFSRPAARAPRRACSRAMPNSILDGISDFKFSTQLVSTVVVAAITVFQVRFEFLAAAWVLYGASFNL